MVIMPMVLPDILTTSDIHIFLTAYKRNPSGLYRLCLDMLSRVTTAQSNKDPVQYTITDIHRLFHADPVLESTLKYPPLTLQAMHTLYSSGSLTGADDAAHMIQMTLAWVHEHVPTNGAVRPLIQRLQTMSLERVKVADIRLLEAGSGNTGTVVRTYWYATQTLDALTYRGDRERGHTTWLQEWTEDDIRWALLFIKLVRWLQYRGHAALEPLRTALIQL